MARTIRIDGTGDGRWIMDRAQGSFDPHYDHAFCSLRDHHRLGGFVVGGFLGSSTMIHMAGADPHWCSPTLLWLVFDYAFNQLGVRKALAVVDEQNKISVGQCLRAGWQIETRVRDATRHGDLLVLMMTREQCRWLKYRTKRYKSGLEIGVS